MKRALPCLLFAAVGCHQDHSLPDTIEARNAARYLLVHWPNGGPDFTREYTSEDRCEAARGRLLREATDEINLADAANEVRRHGTSPPLPIPPHPIAVCLLE